MTTTGSVSRLIDDVRAGHSVAEERLWKRYESRLLALARVKLKGTESAIADEEDVVISAFKSFLHRTRGGSFPNLHNRDDLWRLLVTITVRKAINQRRDQQRERRRPAEGAETCSFPQSLVHLVSSEPTPEFAATMNDLLTHLMEKLADGELQRIVILKLNGYTNAEIASEIGRAIPTVERRVRLIRESWKLYSEDL